VHASQAIGDAESARELLAVVTEKKSHRDALQEGLNRLVAARAQGADVAAPGRAAAHLALGTARGLTSEERRRWRKSSRPGSMGCIENSRDGMFPR